MNRNGVVGEPEDCNVCDGVTVDPDGDGVTEDLIYVDCSGGSNATGDGSPGNPYLTVAHAISQADGTGEEDIVCFKGACTDSSLNLSGMAGKATVYTVAAAGNQVRPFDYPSNPAMIVGWDADGDGEYPPHDTDDTAEFVATGGADYLFNPGQNYVELGHFTARDYGKDDGTAAQGTNGGFSHHTKDYNYFHDIELTGINDNSCLVSGRITFEMFGAVVYHAIENINATEIGGFFVRGSGGNGPAEKGPIRVQNVTVSQRGIEEPGCNQNESSAPVMKLWGYYTGIELLDSVRICDIAGWHGVVPGQPCNGPVADVCTRDWDIINNEFRDVSNSLICQGDAGTCEAPLGRSVDDIVFDRNLFINTNTDPIQEGASAVSIGTFGDEPNELCENVTISNNIFHWEDDEWERGVLYGGDYTGPGSVPGTIKIINNTFYGTVKNADGPYFTTQRQGYIVFDPIQNNKRHDSIIIKNNLIAGGLAGCRNIHMDYAPAGLVSDFNVFDLTCNFHWNGSDGTMTSWRTATGGDLHSQQCSPHFIHAAGDDFHLSSGDTCAQDVGTDVSGHTPWTFEHDIDGEARPHSVEWDIGADEQMSDNQPPRAPTNLRRFDRHFE
jgi:hypothetical protein